VELKSENKGRQQQPAPLPAQLAAALTQAVKSTLDNDAFGFDGRLQDWRDSFVGAYEPAALSDVDGLVDASRLRVLESGIVLAMNSFLAWRARPHQLPMAGDHGFTDLRFDARCPTGVRGTPPHLDLIAARGSRLVAVTCRGCDYLGRKQTRLPDAYTSVDFPDALKPWGRLLDIWRDDRHQFAYADPGALVKFALGLGRTFHGYSLKLVYLYLAPNDAGSFQPFQQHRAELDMIREVVAPSSVTFCPLSATELWDDWHEAFPEPSVRGLVAALRRRYDVAIAPHVGLDG